MGNEISKLAHLRELQKNDDKSLQHIMDEAFQILGNPLVLCDSESRIIAHPLLCNPEYSDYFQDGMIKSDFLRKSINAGFSDIIARPDKVVNLKSKDINMIMGKVYAPHGIVIATLTVNSRYQPFEDVDLIIVETLCMMLSKEILKLPYYENYPYKLLDKYIKKLIDGDIESEKSTFALNIIENIYIGLKENLYVAVADIAKCDPTYAKLECYREMFMRTRPGFKYSIYEHYIVFVISSDDKRFSPKVCLNRLNGIIEKNDIYVGISGRFENLFDMRMPYNEAVDVLRNGLKSGGNQRVFQKNVEE